VANEQQKRPDWWRNPGSIRDKYVESTQALRKEQYEYTVNKAFLAGEQWCYYDGSRNTLRQLPREPSRTRVTLNKLWPSSRNIMSRVLSRPFAFEVEPTDSDDATVRGAQTAKSVVRDLCREHNWQQLREETAWNTWLGGTGILSLDWDPAGKSVVGHIEETGKPYGTGDVTESALTILEACWEPGIRDAERGYWWMRAQALPPSEVQMQYGLDYLPAADAFGTATPLTQKLLQDSRHSAPGANLALVLTVYIRPSPALKKGLVATVVGNKFIDGPKPWPFPFKDRLNMVVLRETKVSGRATGDTVFSAAVPVQTAFNASWSLIIEHLKLAGNARLMVPDASLDGIDDLTDLPGEIMPYNSSGGVAPAYLTPPQLPQYILEQPLRLAEQMDDILGLHDVSRGTAPKNIESGVGLGILVEQDSTPMGQLTKEIAAGFERFASMALKLYEAKVGDKRKARIQVPGQVPETVEWSGKSLMGQTSVVLPPDTVVPRSRAAQMAMAERLSTLGAFGPPGAMNMQMFARVADLPDADDLLEGIDADDAKASRENHLLSIGQVCVPVKFDNHQKHIERHNWFRKTTRYEAMPEEMRQIVDMHVQAHEVMVAEELGAKVAKANVHPVLGAAPTADGTELPGMPAPGGAPAPEAGPAAPPNPGGGPGTPPMLQGPPPGSLGIWDQGGGNGAGQGPQ
jgi:hypothetical protein